MRLGKNALVLPWFILASDITKLAASTSSNQIVSSCKLFIPYSEQLVKLYQWRLLLSFMACMFIVLQYVLFMSLNVHDVLIKFNCEA